MALMMGAFAVTKLTETGTGSSGGQRAGRAGGAQEVGHDINATAAARRGHRKQG